MAKNRSFHLLAVVIVALLGSALITQTSFAQTQDPPIFPLIGSPADYIKGTEEIGGKGYHCDGTVTICGWDYWRPDKGPAVVLASISGTVTHCGDLDGVGNPVVIIQNELWQVGYLHLERIDVACGTTATAGQTIGLTGNIGRLSNWNHLHFWAKNMVTGQFDENQNWPNFNALPQTQPQSQVLGLATQDLSQIPLPILIGMGIAVVFALGLANQRTRGVASLSLLIIMVAGVAFFALYHREEIQIPRDPLAFLIQPTSQPLADQNCEISQKYPGEIQRWCPLITGYAKLRGFDPNFFAAQILQESGGNPVILSHSGAVGLMQVMPRDGIAATFVNEQGQQFFVNRPTIEQLKDPTFNVDYGTGMMEGLRNKFSEGYTAEQMTDPTIQRLVLREALKAYGPRDVGYQYADIVLRLWNTYR